MKLNQKYKYTHTAVYIHKYVAKCQLQSGAKLENKIKNLTLPNVV